MGRTLLDRPVLHGSCNDVGCRKVELFSFLNGLFQCLIHFFRKALLHNFVCKYIFAEDVCYIKIFAHVLSSFHIKFICGGSRHLI